MESLEEKIDLYVGLRPKDLIPIHGLFHFTKRTGDEEHCDTFLKKASIIARAAALTIGNFYFFMGLYRIGEGVYNYIN